MTLPIRDILTSEKSKPSGFGNHGLTIIIKGHEELFFEFGAEDKRNSFVHLLDRQMEDVRKRLASGEAVTASFGTQEALILEEFEARIPRNEFDPFFPIFSMGNFLPAVVLHFTPPTFLFFKHMQSINL